VKPSKEKKPSLFGPTDKKVESNVEQKVKSDTGSLFAAPNSNLFGGDKETKKPDEEKTVT
jgi:hypothetical protein